MAIVPMQCAWCRRLYDDGGNIGDPLPAMLPQTSGGVCHLCVDHIFRQETERAHAAGNLATAVHLERERLRLGIDLARVRRAARAIPHREHGLDPIVAEPSADERSAATV